ncbi:hypothetical protein Ait01nite_075780 [Actinoplanes italicus]|uniref:hypothetical protein n=1 Tax=Actinoplanes italicus TaxID=113567 RepID=UPI0011B269C3|nr:hypothetical protein [Actinoplanes italicus]GIE34533.1 hypothetical protein Ait01nite_075780 [Actinoplanes italicus]
MLRIAVLEGQPLEFEDARGEQGTGAFETVPAAFARIGPEFVEHLTHGLRCDRLGFHFIGDPSPRIDVRRGPTTLAMIDVRADARTGQAGIWISRAWSG